MDMKLYSRVSVVFILLLSASNAVPCGRAWESESIPLELVHSSRQVSCNGVAPLPEAVQLKGIPGIDSNCIAASDVVTLPGTLSALVMDELDASQQAKDIVSGILNPLEAAVRVALKNLTPRANDNICFGNFQSSEMKGEFSLDKNRMSANKCSKLPLVAGQEWSTFAFALTAPFPGCVTQANQTATFCAAVSICPQTKLPTVAVVVGATTMACLGENMAAGDGGITWALTKVASVGLDAIAGGISLSNALYAKANVYTGHQDKKYRLINYEIRGNYYDSILFALKLEKFKVPPVLSLSGASTRIVSVRGLENIAFENTISAFKGGEDSNGFQDDILDLFESMSGVTIQAAMIMNLKLQFKFSKVPGLHKILPDSGVMTIGEMNMFVSTGSATPPGDEYKDLVVKPGVYAFVGSNAVPAIIKGMLEYLLSFVGAVLDLFGDWVPFKLDAKDLLSGFNPGASDHFAFGFTANADQTGIMLNVPLIFDFLGHATFECTTDYKSLRCRVDTNFNSKFFIAIAETIAEGVLWVIKEADEFFTNIGNVIGAALEDAVDSVVSVFSEANMKKTAKMIEKGLVSVGSDIKDELEDWARWAETVFDDFGDILADLTADAIHEIAKFGKSFVDDARDFFENMGKELENAAKFLGDQFKCGPNNVISSITKCPTCCIPMNSVAKFLKNAGNDIASAFDTVLKTLSNVALQAGELFWKKRTSYSTSFMNPNRYDQYQCRMVRVYRIEKKYLLGIKISEKRKYAGDSSDENCVRQILEKAKEVVEDYDEYEKAEKNYESVVEEHQDALFASELSKEDLCEKGSFKCTRDLGRDKIVPGSKWIPVTITCSAKQIGKDGGFSGTIITESLTKDVDVTNTINRGEEIKVMWNEMKELIAEKMTPTLARRR
ncbi:hypothetical protein NDN08_005732 [Rhodosorus marinus]|uniref:Uncharacterized protein n=1 Tax=Rhodosorus marinus TaxID=101924 RepID=A0AAV8V2G6_9RHOD|nr:hypothetical protein NDN08_005732 [Rhodosorus marinus]